MPLMMSVSAAVEESTTRLLPISRDTRKPKLGGTVSIFVQFAATLHVVWFYLAWVPSWMNLTAYEHETAPMPFQGRLLMSFPLRWAHNSLAAQHTALHLSVMHAWFPRGVRPEALVELPIDFLSVLAAGLVARRMYIRAGGTGILKPFIYPLTLIMVFATYAMSTMHRFRFPFDLPSLGLFSLGMWLIMEQRSRFWFAACFLAATVNRETSLFLLPLLLLYRPAREQETAPDGKTNHSRHGDRLLVLLLAAAWLGWHIWVCTRFSGNPSVTQPRFLLNTVTLLSPPAWPQLLSTFAFSGTALLSRKSISLRGGLQEWYWIFPLWGAFMLRYGLLLETRIFGELIPLVACIAAMQAENVILSRLSGLGAEAVSSCFDQSPWHEQADSRAEQG